MDDGKTMEERYGRAADSSHLRLDLEMPGDVDLLIAAGWVKEGLATSLHRLHREFDRAVGPLRLASARQLVLQRLADEQRQLERCKAKAKQEMAAEHAAQAKALAEQAEAEAMTSRALALMSMKSIDGVTRALRHYGEQQAARRGFDGSPDVVRRIVGRVLDLLLDPLCSACFGVGFSGAFGKTKVLCGTCNGSTRRRIDFGGIEAQAFGVWMLADIERKLSRVDQLMRQFMARSTVSAGGVPYQSGASAASAEIRRRIFDLRSAQAESDA